MVRAFSALRVPRIRMLVAARRGVALQTVKAHANAELPDMHDRIVHVLLTSEELKARDVEIPR